MIFTGFFCSRSITFHWHILCHRSCFLVPVMGFLLFILLVQSFYPYTVGIHLSSYTVVYCTAKSRAQEWTINVQKEEVISLLLNQIPYRFALP